MVDEIGERNRRAKSGTAKSGTGSHCIPSNVNPSLISLTIHLVDPAGGLNDTVSSR
jgi:hypothetical protein